MSKIQTILEHSYHIKRNYALMLHKYLLRTQPENLMSDYTKRIAESQTPTMTVGMYLLDEIVNEMKSMLSEQEASPQPGTSGIATIKREPSSSSLSSESDVNFDIASETIETGFSVNDDITELTSLVNTMLTRNALQSSTKTSLETFQKLLTDPTVMYAEYFNQSITLDQIDCDLNERVKNFIKLFKSHGGRVECVKVDVKYYAEMVQANPQILETLTPSVRAAVVSIIDLVTRKQAYDVELTIDAKEFNQISDETVKALLNKYSGNHVPIRFVQSKRQMSPATNNNYNLSTDEEEAALLTPTLKRARRKDSKRGDSVVATAAPASATAAAANPVTPESVLQTHSMSDEAFLANVKQIHSAQMVMPRFLVQLINVMPTVIRESLITCPSEEFGDSKISALNYNTTINIINKMNLTVISENIYFYKLLESLAFYGTSEQSTKNMIWFIAKSCNYFINNARNFNNLRSSLQPLSDDPDRVGLFMIRYNFLWFYRQFAGELVSSPTTPYQSQKIINILYVYNSIVQKEYNSIAFNFNPNRVYVGQVDNVTKLMVVSLSDILA
jgi:hypothetical protein